MHRNKQSVAQMAELVDALVSNTSGAIHPGSIPGLGTRWKKSQIFFHLVFLYRTSHWKPTIPPSTSHQIHPNHIRTNRIRHSWQGRCMFAGSVLLGVIISFSIIQVSCYPCNKRKCVGAYRIRPSRWRGCMLNDDVMLGVIVSFSLTSGRMRYAPTHVRLLSWSNTINHYTCSVEFWADNIMTKPSKRSWRCWLGSHKTVKTIATTLTRVTQNPQNGCDDADSGHTKPSKRSWRRWLGSHKTVETIVTTKLCSHSLINATATVKMSHRSLYRC